MALIMSLSAGFDDKRGEDFETTFGTVHRAKNKLVVAEINGDVHEVKKGGQLMFPAGSSLGEITLKKRLLISQSMTREKLVQVLAAYMQ